MMQDKKKLKSYFEEGQVFCLNHRTRIRIFLANRNPYFVNANVCHRMYLI